MEYPNQVFIDETREILAALEQDVVLLEQQPANADILNRIFRHVHTIKGSGGMFGYENMTEYTHSMENVFDLLRSGKLAVDDHIIDASLRGLDYLRHMLEDKEYFADKAEWQQILEQALAQAGAGIKKDQTESDDEQSSDFAMYHVYFRPGPEIMRNGARPLRILEELSMLGEIQVTATLDKGFDFASFDPEQIITTFDILLAGEIEQKAINEAFIFVEFDSEIRIRRVALTDQDENGLPRLGEILQMRQNLSQEQMARIIEEQGRQKKIGEIAVSRGYVSEQDVNKALQEQRFMREQMQRRQDCAATLRVSACKVDSAVDLIGELVTMQSRLVRRAAQLEDPLLSSIAEGFDFLVADLRQGIMGMRLVQLNDTFVSFRRLVRDLARDTGKSLQLEIHGGETEMDKNVIERLKSALVHLIRNSADHGIENNALRQKRGKPEIGTIKVQANYIGSQVEITVSDDGGGVDATRVKKKALDRGLLTTDKELSQDEVFALLTSPGFSTAEAITDVSGRGVGMDAVKSEVESLQGQLTMESEAGKGTVFRIRLPLTLAIIDSLLLRVNSHHFTVHLGDVEECFILRNAVAVLSSRNRIENRNGLALPYIDLRSYMALEGNTPDIAHVVVIKSAGQLLGLVVDEIMGQHQAVIKPLNSAVATSPAISGSTVLGDGSISFILDAARLAANLAKLEISG